MQTDVRAPVYCTPIVDLKLPPDFFLDTSRPGELTGALAVHNNPDKSWIYLASKGALYQLVFSKKIVRGQSQHLAPKYDPEGVSRISRAEFVWVTHLRAYEKMYRIDNGGNGIRNEFNVIICVDEPHSNDENDGMIGFYRVDGSTNSLQGIDPVVHLRYRKNLGTSDPLRGVEMTSIGLFIATSSTLYFYRKTKHNGLQLEQSTEISPRDFIQDPNHKQLFREIRSIDYTAKLPENKKGYLTVSTDVGTFVSNLDTNKWADISVHRGVVQGETINPVVSYARLEAEGRLETKIYFSACEDVFQRGSWKPGAAEVGQLSGFNWSYEVEWPCMKPEYWDLGDSPVLDDFVLGRMDIEEVPVMTLDPAKMSHEFPNGGLFQQPMHSMRDDSAPRLTYPVGNLPYHRSVQERQTSSLILRGGSSVRGKKRAGDGSSSSRRRSNTPVSLPQLSFDEGLNATVMTFTPSPSSGFIPQHFEDAMLHGVSPHPVAIPSPIKHSSAIHVTAEPLSRSYPMGNVVPGFSHPTQLYLSDPTAGAYSSYHGMAFRPIKDNQ